MTPLQKLTLRASEIRTRLNELGGIAEQTDETRSEIETLSGEYKDVETRSQALMVAGDEPVVTHNIQDGASKELRQLIADASMGIIFNAVLEHRATDGREKELQDHFKLAGNQIPLDMLRMESRATGVTAAPSDVQGNQHPIIPAVFPDGVAAFLGIGTPSVPTGEAIFPVLSTSADAGVPAENAEQDETAGGFTADVLKPGRIQAAFFYSREDAARFAGMDESLRANLSDALSDKLDQQILNGDEGLFHSTNLANHNASAVTSYANYKSHHAYSRVDGKWASSVADLRIVMGSGTYAHASTVYRGNNADQSVLDELAMKTGGVRVSAHIPAVSGNKQNSVIRLGNRMDMVSPLWDAVSLIPDEVTLAKKGQIQITAILLFAVKILRTGGFYKQQSQHA